MDHLASILFRLPADTKLPISGCEIRRTENWIQVITKSVRHPSANEVILSRVADDDLDATVEQVVSEYEAHELPFKWCVGPDTRPAHTGDRLVHQGLTETHYRGMSIPTDAALAIPGALTVRSIEPGEIECYVACFAAGWELESDVAELLRTQVRVGLEMGHEFFVVQHGEETIGAASTAVASGLGYLNGGVVVPQQRGRGAYRALVAARLAALRRRGVNLAVTQAREQTSAPLLEVLGFDTVYFGRVYMSPRALGHA